MRIEDLLHLPLQADCFWTSGYTAVHFRPEKEQEDFYTEMVLTLRDKTGSLVRVLANHVDQDGAKYSFDRTAVIDLVLEPSGIVHLTWSDSSVHAELNLKTFQVKELKNCTYESCIVEHMYRQDKLADERRRSGCTAVANKSIENTGLRDPRFSEAYAPISPFLQHPDFFYPKKAWDALAVPSTEHGKVPALPVSAGQKGRPPHPMTFAPTHPTSPLNGSYKVIGVDKAEEERKALPYTMQLRSFQTSLQLNPYSDMNKSSAKCMDVNVVILDALGEVYSQEYVFYGLDPQALPAIFVRIGFDPTTFHGEKCGNLVDRCREAIYRMGDVGESDREHLEDVKELLDWCRRFPNAQINVVEL